MEEFVKFFFEKHPYVPPQFVKFEQDGEEVVARIKGVGESRAKRTEDGTIVGFDVLRLEDELVLFNRQNFENAFLAREDFAVPAKAPDINPTLSVPLLRGVIALKKYGFVADVERQGDLYSVQIFDDNDNLVRSETLLSKDEARSILREYGFDVNDLIFESGGTISTAEKAMVLLDEEEAEPRIEKVGGVGARMFKLGSFYSPPVVEIVGKKAVLADGSVRIFLASSTPHCDEKFLLASDEIVVPQPILVKSAQKGDVCVFSGDTAATEPFLVTKGGERHVIGVGQDGTVVEVVVHKDVEPHLEKTASRRVYFLPEGWKIYKLGQTVSRVSEKVREFTITRLSANAFVVEEGEKRTALTKERLKRFLVRIGADEGVVEAALQRLENFGTVKVSVYQEAKAENAENQEVFSFTKKFKLKKLSQILGTLHDAEDLNLLGKAQQKILELLEEEEDQSLRKVLLVVAKGLDRVIGEYAARFYKERHAG
ncbi:MAG: hypothetical protein QW650_00020 [Thermofilum sp.]